MKTSVLLCRWHQRGKEDPVRLQAVNKQEPLKRKIRKRKMKTKLFNLLAAITALQGLSLLNQEKHTGLPINDSCKAAVCGEFIFDGTKQEETHCI